MTFLAYSKSLTPCVPTLQNGETHSNNSSAAADLIYIKTPSTLGGCLVKPFLVNPLLPDVAYLYALKTENLFLMFEVFWYFQGV